MLKVFHLNVNKDPLIWFTARKVSGAAPLWAERETWYSLVAHVDCKLDQVFDLTNHSAPGVPEEGWHLGEKVNYLGTPGGTRSTSVGDVVVDELDQAWLCQPIGWGRIL